MTNSVLNGLKNQWISELDAFTDYISHSNKSISDAQRQFEQQLSTTNDSEKTKIIIGSDQMQEHSKLNSIFPHFFRLSTFVGLQFSLENRLTVLCSRIHESKKFKIKASDLRGENIIEKSRQYLSLVIGLDLDSLNNEWTILKDYIKIRNCIVHNNSRVFNEKDKMQQKEQELYKTMSKYPSLRVEDYGLFYITDDKFLHDVVAIHKTYLTKLLDIADSSIS